MPLPSRAALCCFAAASAVAWQAPVAFGQEEPPPEPEPQAEVSAEDQAAIEAALGEDQDQPEAQPPEAADTSAQPVARQAAGSGVQSMNPDLSLIADVALAWFSEDKNYQTGAHDPRATGFTLQQLELAVGAAVDPYFRFDANIVFALFGVEVEEVYATTLDLPARLQVRAGQFLTRFGRINASHVHSWSFVDQPFAIGRIFGGEGNRGLGGELSWLAPLPWYVELLGSVTEADGEATARSFYGASDLGVDGPLDFQYTGAIKQFWPLDEDTSLSFGLSGATGPNGTGRDNRTDVYGLDLYLKWRPISYQSYQELALQSEWFYRRRQVPEAVLQDVSGYAQLTFRFAQRWMAGGRYEYGSPAVDSAGEQVTDYLDPEWSAGRHRLAANMTFFPTEFSRLRLQGASDIPTWEPAPIWALFFALEVVTGAHGAHKF